MDFDNDIHEIIIMSRKEKEARFGDKGSTSLLLAFHVDP